MLMTRLRAPRTWRPGDALAGRPGDALAGTALSCLLAVGSWSFNHLSGELPTSQPDAERLARRGVGGLAQHRAIAGATHDRVPALQRRQRGERPQAGDGVSQIAVGPVEPVA